MFRIVSFIAYGIVFLGIIIHHFLFPCGYSPRFSPGSLIRKKVHLFTLLFPEQKLNWPGKIRKCVFLLGLFFISSEPAFGARSPSLHEKGTAKGVKATGKSEKTSEFSLYMASFKV